MGSGCATRQRKVRCGRVAIALSVTMIVTSLGLGAQQEVKKTNLAEKEARERLNDTRYPFDRLLEGDRGAIANSERIFALTEDKDRKQRIASILVSLGVKDPIYRNYLRDAARKALVTANDIPWSMLYDQHGNAIDNKMNPAFLEWCRKHKARPLAMHNAAYYEIPTAWYYLAAAGDPQSYDLLVEGLHSQNLMIAGTAAQGLAKLQQPRAVDVLISAGRKAPGEARYAIAQSLLYFSDVRAQAAAEELMTDKKGLEIDKRRAETKGVKGLFPW